MLTFFMEISLQRHSECIFLLFIAFTVKRDTRVPLSEESVSV